MGKAPGVRNKKPIILWLRRDLRLADHPALLAACATGGAVIPLVIRDDSITQLGAAPKWRLGLSMAQLAQSLEARGSRLVLRSGPTKAVLLDLATELDAGAVYWSRLYDPDSIDRDTAVKAALTAQGVTAQSFAGHLLFEPWTVKTKQGGFYRVFTPMWNAVRNRDVEAPAPPPGHFPAPDIWPESEALSDWQMGAEMRRGLPVCAGFQRPGEACAQDRLGWFTGDAIHDYKSGRNLPGVDATSAMSDYLALGEVSIRQCWHTGMNALNDGSEGAETWLKELVWREFAYHLMYHTPQILTDNWRSEWSAFPWSTDDAAPHVMAWKQGRTGVPFVDAAMREMYVTGRMHNRGRMIVASYLTKHLMTHWRVGQKWFAECLTDWDPASNAMGWQWAAGSGPDAAPYFRIFNPVTQLEKFDPRHDYTARWIAEGMINPSPTALAYFDAIPRSWGLSPKDDYPSPVVNLAEGRARALEAYASRGF